MQKNILVDFKINNNQLNQLLSVLGFILWVIRLSINLILNVHFRWGLSGVFLLVFVFDIIENVWGFNITWDISNYVLFRFMLWMINHYIFKFTCAKIVGKCKKKKNKYEGFKIEKISDPNTGDENHLLIVNILHPESLILKMKSL